MKKVLVVGAGFSGATVANLLANAGFHVHIIDERSHIGGNCYTYEDTETGVTVHKYGPHIFHTDDEIVWAYINKFTQMIPYKLQVKATTGSGVFSLPINLHTINQFFNKTFSPCQARDFVATNSLHIENIKSFEDQALKFLGNDLYNEFFKGYPIKQWGIHPSQLPASVLKRLPVRFNYDDNYFAHKYQGIPIDGYTNIFKKMLGCDNIELLLNEKFNKSWCPNYSHVFYTGTIDGWFDYKLGRLQYRTLQFEKFYGSGDIQGCAVMSYPEESVPYTRIAEHKYFTPWNKYDKSVAFKEFSLPCGLNDTPYYPIRLVEDTKLLREYVNIAQQERHVTFLGRLGTYRYLDMDITIKEAMKVSTLAADSLSAGLSPQVFYNNPLD